MTEELLKRLRQDSADRLALERVALSERGNPALTSYYRARSQEATTPIGKNESCPFEGAVIEPCSNCQGELKHVRQCYHEQNPTEKCTRIYVGPKVPSCQLCILDPRKALASQPPPTTKPLPEPLAALPIVEPKRGFKWSYGVTTVPMRRRDLFPKTLASLRAAGFDKPRLFVDGEKDPGSWEKEFGLEVTARFPHIRTFGNWILSLAELYIREPNADLYAVFQDDFITYINLRAYLERCQFPEKGYWNLYTFPENQRLAPNGVTGWYPSNQFGRGAVATVFNREGVLLLLHHKRMINRPTHVDRGWRAVDGGIIWSMKKESWTEYVHNPSLVQHIGRISSMGNKPHKEAVSFLGEKYDALSLVEKRS